jgi:hypothetical protein
MLPFLDSRFRGNDTVETRWSLSRPFDTSFALLTTTQDDGGTGMTIRKNERHKTFPFSGRLVP